MEIIHRDQLKPLAASLKYITGYLIELSLSIDYIIFLHLKFCKISKIVLFGVSLRHLLEV
jgi:predicted tellurium resistance membrane protein TerC